MIGNKRVLAALLAAALMLSGTLYGALAASLDEIILPYGETEAEMTGKTVPYIKDFGGEEYETGEVKLYFIGDGDIPYVALSEYMPLLSEALEKNADRPGISYDISRFMDHVYRIRRGDVESEMWVDTENDTIDFDNFNGFTQLAEVAASVAMLDLPEPQEPDIEAILAEMEKLPLEEQTDYLIDRMQRSGKPESMFATITDTINRGGAPISLNMKDYLIDLVEQNGECYVPMQTMNDLFMSPLYLYFIYNEGSPLLHQLWQRRAP